MSPTRGRGGLFGGPAAARTAGTGAPSAPARGVARRSGGPATVSTRAAVIRTSSALRPLGAPVVVLALAAVLVGCAGAGSSPGRGAATGPGRADASDFVQGTPTDESSAGPSRSSGTPTATPSAQPAPEAGQAAPARTLPPGPDGRPAVFSHGPRDRPRVALTFDGDMTVGMQARLRSGRTASYDNTALLAELRRLRVPATFFLTGLWIETYPDQARGIATDPLFEVASHSQTHRGFAGECYGLGRVPVGEMAGEVRAPFERLRDVPGARTVPYFRFPGGCHDDAALAGIAAAGATPVQWDVVSGDADGASGAAIAARVLDGVRNGSVVVLHNSLGPAAHTADAIAAIVAGLRARGFELVRVSDLVGAAVGDQ